MIFNENTKLIARIHSKPNARGLNIYNPYFEEMKVNAAYILFYNNTPQKLLDACRGLQFVGVNTAGFETDPAFTKLITAFDDSSKLVGHIGYLKLENGKYKAYYQGGEGLLQAILSKFDVNHKELVVVGAGNVATSLIDTIRLKGLTPKKITVVNRTLDKAISLTKKIKNIDTVLPISELNNVRGDILINATHVGGSAKDDIFSEQIINNFKGLVDVTFETEETNLTNLAVKLKLPYVSGWDFFTYQGKVFLENVLGIEIDEKVLRKHVANGLKSTI